MTEKRLLLAGGSVFDARSGQVTEADVVVSGSRIAAVGRGLDADEAVDCSGSLLVPGFIDCHTHVCMAETKKDPFGLPRSARPLSAVPVLATLLRRGVTTVRDAWGADAGVRLAVARGWIEGPEVLVSLRQVSTTGGIGDHWAMRSGPVDCWFIRGPVIGCREGALRDADRRESALRDMSARAWSAGCMPRGCPSGRSPS